MAHFSYQDFLRSVRTTYWIIPAVTCAFVLLALMWMNITTPKYTAEMVLGPTAQTGVAARGIRLPIETLQNETIRGNPTETSADETLSDFSRVVQLLTSPEIAARLLEDKELDLAAHLKQDSGIKSFLWRLAGQKLNTTQDASSVSAMLARDVRIDTIGRSAMRKVTFRHADRIFAEQLLNALYKASDAHLRAQAETRTTAEIAYLQIALQRVTLTDQKKVLLDLLASQERTRLLIVVDLPFAADQIQKAVAPLNPDWPPVGLVLFFAILCGLFAGFSLVYAMAVHQWVSRQQ